MGALRSSCIQYQLANFYFYRSYMFSNATAEGLLDHDILPMVPHDIPYHAAFVNCRSLYIMLYVRVVFHLILLLGGHT